MAFSVEELEKQFGVVASVDMDIYKQGDPGGSVFVVRKGRVQLIREVSGQRRLVAEVGPGGMFGEMAVIVNHKRDCTARVVEEAQLLKIPSEKLEQMVVEVPEIAIRLIQHLAQSLDRAHRIIDAVMYGNATRRDKNPNGT